MSGRSRSLPNWASAGGQELQPCEVKSSIAHGPDEGPDGGAAETEVPKAAVAAAPISTDRRPGVKMDMAQTWASRSSPANQEQSRGRGLPEGNIITIHHARSCFSRYRPARHERPGPRRGGAGRGRRPVALPVVGPMSVKS